MRISDCSSDVCSSDLPENLSAAANRLTADDPGKLLSLVPLIEELEEEARGGEIVRAVSLKALAGAMRADGLGLGGIHLRACGRAARGERVCQYVEVSVFAVYLKT